MAPRIIFIRHGQAIHNTMSSDEGRCLVDPLLTKVGRMQAKQLPQVYPQLFADLDPLTSVILSSPLRRTVQTTLLGFNQHLPSSMARTATPAVPTIFLPQLQESNDLPCDTGGPLEETREMFPGWINWDNCKNGWNVKRGFYCASPEAIAKRARWVRCWLRDREEKVIVVVCHHGFLRALCGIPKKAGIIQWENTEAREYTFQDATLEDPEATLVRVDDAEL